MEYSEDHCNCPICDEINDRGSEVHCEHFLTAINVDDATGKACYLDDSWEALEGLLEELSLELTNHPSPFVTDLIIPHQDLQCEEDEGVQKVFEVFSFEGGPASNIWEYLGAVFEQPEGIIHGSGISWSKSTFCFHEDPATAREQLDALYSKVIDYLKVDTKEKLLANKQYIQRRAETLVDKPFHLHDVEWCDHLTKLVQKIDQLGIDSSPH